MSSLDFPFQRPQAQRLKARCLEPRRWLQWVTGPRQVGKTTLVQQLIQFLQHEHGMSARWVTADAQAGQGEAWLIAQWETARHAARTSGQSLLAIDEVQKIPNWSEQVKRLWDEDTARGNPLKVIVLGSAPLLLQAGLSESLAGRFERLHLPHWSLSEMQQAFGISLEEYLFFGAYPGATPLINDPERWRRYVVDSLIETTVTRDILMMTRIHKPALMRRLFDLGCQHSGQIMSYTKMLGQLQEAGNTTTLAHYLELLAHAGLLTGLPRFAGTAQRQRASSPKFQVLNTALLSALSELTPSESRQDTAWYGRLVESAVGAHLANAAAQGDVALFYWRQGDEEVDFVIRHAGRVAAIEVKSTAKPASRSGLQAFVRAFKPDHVLMVGGDGIALETFLKEPVQRWLSS